MSGDAQSKIPFGTGVSRKISPSPYGYFAFVMATGIVSIAAGLAGLRTISISLLVVNVVAFPGLWVVLAVHLLRGKAASVLADLADHQRAPGMLTIVAATCVVGNEIAAATAYQNVAAGLWIGALVLWFALIYCFFVAMTITPDKPVLGSGIDGSWLLLVVATQALSILTTRVGSAVLDAEIASFAGLCLFLLGGTFYLILLVMIIHRWLFAPMRPGQFTAPYWINMGAAAISALAGTRLFMVLGADPMLAPVRSVVFTATVLFWSFASWWIPLLLVLALWRYRSLGVRSGYRPENWSIVFPLGMYTTASWRLSHDLGLQFPQPVPAVFIWIALAAWVLTSAGMVRNTFGAQRGAKTVP
jgi:tellurite resistance protein TehA-like permease